MIISLQRDYSVRMSPSIALPIGMNVVAALGVTVIVGFTVIEVLATAPVVTTHAQTTDATPLHYETHSGIVSWISEKSISITDQSGVQRVFDINSETSITTATAEPVTLKYYEVHMLDHVRIDAAMQGENSKALHILDIR